MCNGLVTSIERLGELSGDATSLRSRLSESQMGANCLILGDPIDETMQVIVVMVESGRNVLFRLVQVIAVDDLGKLQQPFALIEDEATLKRALNFVLSRGVVMGSARYVRPRVFIEREQPAKPCLKLNPPQIVKKMVVLRRELDHPGLICQRMKP